MQVDDAAVVHFCARISNDNDNGCILTVLFENSTLASGFVASSIRGLVLCY